MSSELYKLKETEAAKKAAVDLRRLRESVEKLPDNDSNSCWKEEIFISRAVLHDDQNTLAAYARTIHHARLLLSYEDAAKRLCEQENAPHEQ